MEELFPEYILAKSSLREVSLRGDCYVTNHTTQWILQGNKENQTRLISDETEALVLVLHGMLLLPLLFVFGAPFNILNMIVFRMQGLQDRMNLCLFSLAVVDLLYLTFVFLFRAARAYWRLVEPGVYMDRAFRFMIRTNLRGLYGLAYGPYFLSAIISTEKCLSLLCPLKAEVYHRYVSTKVLAIIIATGIAVSIGLRFVVLARMHVVCIYVPGTGEKKWTVERSPFYEDHKDLIDKLNSVFFGFFCLVLPMSVVVITTVITALRLHQIIRPRSIVSSASSSVSTKEISLARMIVCLCVVFVLLAFPIVVLRFSKSIHPQLSLAGDFRNLRMILVYGAELSSYANSVVNFNVYYACSAKYKATLLKVLPSLKGSRIDIGQDRSAGAGGGEAKDEHANDDQEQ